MASIMVRSKRNLKISESGKWQSRWLENNLQEMDRSVKRMLKLIEEDAADSLAKKVEIYYQKRPELVALVDEIYRMYRSLAEKYDDVTSELRKTSSLDLQSQTSSNSDVSTELPFLTEQRMTRRPSGRRAAGFEVFLGSGGTASDVYQREVDELSSLTDSGHESDDSSVNNYSSSTGNSVDYHALNRRIMDLEIELRDAKENPKMQQEGDVESSLPRLQDEKSVADLNAKIAAYEQELEDANRKIWISELEIKRLKTELGRDDPSDDEIIYGLEEGETLQELSITKKRLKDAEKEIASLKQQIEGTKSADQKLKSLQHQLELVQKEAVTWKSKVNAADKREVMKLKDRISMLKSSLAIRDHEIRELKLAISDAEQKIFPEKAQIKAEISKLMEERTHQEEQLKELESCVRSLEDDIRRITKEKMEMEERLNSEIENLKAETAEQANHIGNLNEGLNVLKSERDGLNADISLLSAKISSKDERIDQVDRQLQELEKTNVDVRSRIKEMEEEVERQRRMIEEAAEEKREAIRQLCFSLEHYRDGYVMLLKAFAGHGIKEVAVLAS